MYHILSCDTFSFPVVISFTFAAHSSVLAYVGYIFLVMISCRSEQVVLLAW